MPSGLPWKIGYRLHSLPNVMNKPIFYMKVAEDVRNYVMFYNNKLLLHVFDGKSVVKYVYMSQVNTVVTFKSMHTYNYNFHTHEQKHSCEMIVVNRKQKHMFILLYMFIF